MGQREKIGSEIKESKSPRPGRLIVEAGSRGKISVLDYGDDYGNKPHRYKKSKILEEEYD